MPVGVEHGSDHKRVKEKPAVESEACRRESPSVVFENKRTFFTELQSGLRGENKRKAGFGRVDVHDNRCLENTRHQKTLLLRRNVFNFILKVNKC